MLAVNGAVVTLSAPLLYNHTVELVREGSRSVMLHTEVINLNRNVRIVGSSGSGTAGFGGHVMLLQPTDGEA